MEYAFILLFLYASYLSVEKYVHTGSVLKWRGRRRPVSAPPVKEEPVEPREETSEEAVIGRGRERVLGIPPTAAVPISQGGEPVSVMAIPAYGRGIRDERKADGDGHEGEKDTRARIPRSFREAGGRGSAGTLRDHRLCGTSRSPPCQRRDLRRHGPALQVHDHGPPFGTGTVPCPPDSGTAGGDQRGTVSAGRHPGQRREAETLHETLRGQWQGTAPAGGKGQGKHHQGF